MVAETKPGAAGSTQRPLFGGYVLPAAVVAWLAGIALSHVEPLTALSTGEWLLVAALAALLWLGAALIGQRAPGSVQRTTLALGLLLCCAALGAARAVTSDPAHDPHSIGRLAASQSIEMRGVVTAEPDLRDGRRLLTIETSAASQDGGATWQPTTGRVEATVYGPDDWFAPAYGDTLEVTGTLNPLAGAYAPPGVVATIPNARAYIQARGGGNPLLAWLYDLRVRLARIIQGALPEPEAALLIGILLGLKTPVLRARLALFTTTGTIHLVVPAGLKVSVLAELVAAGVSFFGRWPRTIAGLLAVGAYAALGGGGPAAVRAAIMGALLVLAPALGRRYNVFTALALAVLAMTLAEPLVLYDAGFQLTVLATLGLPLFTPVIQRWLLARLGRLARRASVRVAAELVAVTLAAQLATLPVLALTFHLVSLIAPLANLLAVPLLAPLMLLGGALALAGLLPGALGGLLPLALGWVVWPLLWLVNAAITLCAALPFAALAVPDLPGLVAWLYYALLAALWWGARPWLRHWRARRHAAFPANAGMPTSRAIPASSGHVRLGRAALVGLVALSLLGAFGAAAPIALADGTAHLDLLDVGAGGEATLLRLPSGVTVLINGGASGPALETALAEKIPFWRRSLDLALLTDPRPGDLAGLRDAADHFHIAQAADAGMAHPTTEYLAWLDALSRTGAQHTRIRQGSVITLDATSTLRVLSPPQTLFPPDEGDTTAANDLILRLETPGLRALFLGGADAYALDALAGSGQSLAADVVEVALAPGQALDLPGPLGDVLRLAHPQLIVVAEAPIPPDSLSARRAALISSWITDGDAAKSLGAQVYRVSAAGTISLSGDANGWTLGG